MIQFFLGGDMILMKFVNSNQVYVYMIMFVIVFEKFKSTFNT